MRKNLLNNKLSPASTLNCVKALAIASVFLVFPLQGFAEKAINYGDINDESDRYVTWTAESTDAVKTAYQTKSSNKKVLKVKTSKVSKGALTNEYQTGYGDENQD